MSRWLWGLLAGVVLVAIAAVFWVDQTSVLPPVSRSTTPVAPAPSPAPLRRTPRPRLRPHLRPRPRRKRPRPLRLRRPMQDSKPLARSDRAVPRKARGSADRRAGAFASRPPKRPCRRPRPDERRRQKPRANMLPRALRSWSGPGPIPQADCERLFQRRGGRWAYREPVDKFAQAAIVELPKKILLPSAICRIEGASVVEGMLKVSADCEDSISYTPRSVMIALRSPTELVYSASGDAALATTLKKCAP